MLTSSVLFGVFFCVGVRQTSTTWLWRVMNQLQQHRHNNNAPSAAARQDRPLVAALRSAHWRVRKPLLPVTLRSPVMYHLGAGETAAWCAAQPESASNKRTLTTRAVDVRQSTCQSTCQSDRCRFGPAVSSQPAIRSTEQLVNNRSAVVACVSRRQFLQRSRLRACALMS